ncbi:MAG: helix-turn-helix domain-containing protein [Verrucomicrobiae bacterium]|nr:helix-turn-helix domain-containing protein [Verrucomicrobiae bacterium]MCP5542018.1 helix-turn-helix domain-containing protein [Akkermansiaceae bacterium]
MELAIDCGLDHKSFRRLNAIRLLLIGTPYDQVFRNSRMNPRTLRLWERCFKEMGIDGSIHRPGTGRPRIVEHEGIEAKVLPVVGDPALAGQTHWKARKLCGWLNETLDADLSYRTVVRFLHEHDYKSKIPQPMPEPLRPRPAEIVSHGSPRPGIVPFETSRFSSVVGAFPTQAEMEAIVAKEIERLGARPSWAFATEPCGFYSLG